MYLTFAYPNYLFLLLMAPLIVLIHFLTLKRIKKRALKFANFEAISKITGVEFFSKNIVISLLSIFIVFLLVLSISGLTLHKQADASSFSFILAIDSSRSMEAQDMLPNRLESAKEIAKEFVKVAPQTTAIGVISFSGNSYIHQDLTKNKNLINEAIDNIEQSMIEGTDICEAVITSTNLLRRGEEGKAIVLLSDGQINVGDLEDAITYANDNDVIINTIAIGTEEGGKTSYGLSKLDEDSLKALEYQTGGEFFKAQDKATLSESFNKAMKLTTKKVSIDLSNYLLLATIFFFVIEYVLASSKYRSLP